MPPNRSCWAERLLLSSAKNLIRIMISTVLLLARRLVVTIMPTASLFMVMVVVSPLPTAIAYGGRLAMAKDADEIEAENQVGVEADQHRPLQGPQLTRSHRSDSQVHMTL